MQPFSRILVLKKAAKSVILSLKVISLVLKFTGNNFAFRMLLMEHFRTQKIFERIAIGRAR